ncbi:MAG: JAB domain-containing protein [Christensenellales bacterium]
MHTGHKSRLRAKALKDIESLQEHEIIELLLNYSIVRKNTNPIAHDLIKTFKSISNVMDADLSSLLKIEGLGEVSASLLVLIPKICHIYNKSKCAEYSKVSNIAESEEYFRTLLGCLDHEEAYALCLNKYDKIVSLIKLGSGNIDSVQLTTKDALLSILSAKPHQVILSHNHLNNSAYPSDADTIFTGKLAKELADNGIILTDHIIVSGNETFSYKRTKMLQNGRLEL